MERIFLRESVVLKENLNLLGHFGSDILAGDSQADTD